MCDSDFIRYRYFQRIKRGCFFYCAVAIFGKIFFIFLITLVQIIEISSINLGVCGHILTHLLIEEVMRGSAPEGLMKGR